LIDIQVAHEVLKENKVKEESKEPDTSKL